MADCLIQVKNVDFAYPGGDPVLTGVDLHVSPGQKIGLVGGNGCGKTTLLHMIVGLLKTTNGCIHAFGCERKIEKDFIEVRKRAGLVFQNADDQLFCPTVIEDVAFGLLNLGMTANQAREIALESLELLGIDGFADRITYKLSGGEKRLVTLAAVLAMGPEVLLLDEPTTGLDDASRERLIAVLNDLPQAMIIVSHERDFLDEVVDELLQLKEGKILH